MLVVVTNNNGTLCSVVGIQLSSSQNQRRMGLEFGLLFLNLEKGYYKGLITQLFSCSGSLSLLLQRSAYMGLTSYGGAFFYSLQKWGLVTSKCTKFIKV